MAGNRNLVFIFSDQQRYDTMACYGNHWINTPNLNALAARSFVFRNCYVTQAVCAASRGSLMTGLYPHTAGPVVNGMRLPQNVPCIAQMVSAD
jgi:arylsulfatase A-like enzyme